MHKLTAIVATIAAVMMGASLIVPDRTLAMTLGAIGMSIIVTLAISREDFRRMF